MQAMSEFVYVIFQALADCCNNNTTFHDDLNYWHKPVTLN